MPTIPQPAGFPKTILNRLVAAIRRYLAVGDVSFTEMNCFTAPTPYYHPSLEPTTIQVCPGAVKPEGSGNGGQGGNCRTKRGNVVFAVFYQLNLDPYGQVSEALSGDAGNILDLGEALNALFAFTSLGNGVLEEPMRWEYESIPQVVDPEKKVLRRDVTWSCRWYEDLPNAVTLAEADFA